MARTNFSKQPSPYNRFLFHGLRSVQFVSSAIVTSMLSYFVHYLIQDSYYIPWTFLVGLAVSAFTIIWIIVSSIFYHNRTFTPRMSIYANSGLCVLWILGFALLYWNLSGTLSHACNYENWHNDAGIMVCNIYKALAAFEFFGLFSTLLTLSLDIYTQRKIHGRGVYNAMGDAKGLQSRQNPYTNVEDNVGDEHTELRDGDQQHQMSDWDARIEFPGQVLHDSRKPYNVNRPLSANKFGYQQPAEQTQYDGAGPY